MMPEEFWQIEGIVHAMQQVLDHANQVVVVDGAAMKQLLIEAQGVAMWQGKFELHFSLNFQRRDELYERLDVTE